MLPARFRDVAHLEDVMTTPSAALVDGLRPTYEWVRAQVMRNARPGEHAVQGRGSLERAEPQPSPTVGTAQVA